jgi:hypothetical protein
MFSNVHGTPLSEFANQSIADGAPQINVANRAVKLSLTPFFGLTRYSA